MKGKVIIGKILKRSVGEVAQKKDGMKLRQVNFNPHESSGDTFPWLSKTDLDDNSSNIETSPDSKEAIPAKIVDEPTSNKTEFQSLDLKEEHKSDESFSDADWKYLEALAVKDYDCLNKLENGQDSLSSIFDEIIEHEPQPNSNYQDDVFEKNIQLLYDETVDLDHSKWQPKEDLEADQEEDLTPTDALYDELLTKSVLKPIKVINYRTAKDGTSDDVEVDDNFSIDDFEDELIKKPNKRVLFVLWIILAILFCALIGYVLAYAYDRWW